MMCRVHDILKLIFVSVALRLMAIIGQLHVNKYGILFYQKIIIYPVVRGYSVEKYYSSFGQTYGQNVVSRSSKLQLNIYLFPIYIYWLNMSIRSAYILEFEIFDGGPSSG